MILLFSGFSYSYHVSYIIGSALATALTTISVRIDLGYIMILLLIIFAAGRIRKGPAPVCYSFADYTYTLTYYIITQLNLEIPQYDFNEAEGKLVIG